jgi:hypothetical protein
MRRTSRDGVCARELGGVSYKGVELGEAAEREP